MKQMQASKLDDYTLQLQFSTARKKSAGGAAAANEKGPQRKAVDIGKTSNKLLIRNVPFEATVKELKELFGMCDMITHECTSEYIPSSLKLLTTSHNGKDCDDATHQTMHTHAPFLSFLKTTLSL